MRRRLLAGLAALTVVAASSIQAVHTAGPSPRKPLDAKQRAAVLALVRAADTAQVDEAGVGGGLQWETATLKTTTGSAYVPFRVRLADASDVPASAVVYVRAVSRKGGVPRTDEQSVLRAWVEEQGFRATPWLSETVMMAPGDFPVSGLAAASGKRSIQQASQSSTALALVTRAREKEKVEAEAAHPTFPFEEYYFVNPKSPRGSDPHAIERAMALPPGEYDVYVALLDETRKDASPVVIRQVLSIPDFWNDRLRLSTLMLVSDVHALEAPFPAEQQSEHAFAFGRAEIVPVAKTLFTTDEALSVVYQVCNYGTPDSDLSADYNFYRDVNGTRRLFNRTDPQQYDDATLPPTSPWTAQAFLMQAVPLKRFSSGRYELEVVVKDRLTRTMATSTVAFTVVDVK